MVHKGVCCSTFRNEQSVRHVEKQYVAGVRANQIDKDCMVLIPGGRFLMGSEEGDYTDGESPIREVEIDAFYIDACTVTNQQFATFVEETGYITEAEIYGWSFVFYQFVSKSVAQRVTQVVQQTPWWWVVEGAKWNTPDGPDSSIANRLDHPVTHVSWHDAMAYCRWAGKRLPTEAEWEFAARGGLVQMSYPWGDKLQPEGKYLCNIWQGDFPITNTGEDGYIGAAPVKTYQPNTYGLYQMVGNVWEWCNDWFSVSDHAHALLKNPTGPPRGKTRVMRGGSYLCHDSYCKRYRVAARTSNTPDSASGNIGFRCVADTV